MERVMSELSMFFSSKRDIDVYLIILGKGEQFYKLTKRVKIIEPSFIFNNKFRLFFTFKTIFFLRNSIKKINPDAVLSFGEMYNSFVIIGTLNLNTKIFVSDRSKPNKRWGFLHEKLRKILYKKANGIIAQTSYAKSFLYNETKHTNIEIIPNPVRSNVFKKIKKQKVLLNVGRLIYSKRVDILLNIFSQLKNNDEWNLWIIGDGPEREFLENLSRKLNINSKVKFWGKQKNVGSFYAQAEIFTFTSISEGFPNAILEAMNMGLPCISFDCIAGPSDIIKDGYNGFLIPELSIKKYRARLEELIMDNNLRATLGYNAKVDSMKYNINKIGDKYLKFMLS